MKEEPKPNPADTPPEQIPTPGPGRSPKEVEVEIPGDTSPPVRGRGKERGKMVTWPPEFLESGIQRYISTAVPSVAEDAPAKDAAGKLDNPTGVAFVTDTTGRLKGIITKADLAKLAQAQPPAQARALGTMGREAGGPGVVAIRNTAQCWQLLKIMNGENFRRQILDVLPVVDQDNKPVGVILKETLRQRMPQDLAAAQR